MTAEPSVLFQSGVSHTCEGGTITLEVQREHLRWLALHLISIGAKADAPGPWQRMMFRPRGWWEGTRHEFESSNLGADCLRQVPPRTCPSAKGSFLNPLTSSFQIRKRDKQVYKRQEAGHWEADTVVSGLGKSKACFVTLAERKTRYYIAMKLPDKKAATVEEGIVKLLSQFPTQLVKSITCDRGTEFANWANIESRLNCDVYFADRIVRGKKAQMKTATAY